MKLWLLLTLAFLVQEPISTGAVLLEVYKLHYNLWIIHLLFAATTLLDIVVGYWLGKFIDKKWGKQKMVAWVRVKFEKFSAFMGESGKVVALIVYAPIIFPFSGIFIPWLDISLTEALIFIFIGEVIFWYLPEWLLVLGIKTFATDPFTLLYAIVIVTTLLVFIPKYFSRRRGTKKP